MNGRTYDERAKMRRERRASGSSSVRITKATKQLLHELLETIPPHEVRGEDEMLWELVSAELERRRAQVAAGRIHLSPRANGA